jgi:spore germination cell wall hydrolase CwlJ-like protein
VCDRRSNEPDHDAAWREAEYVAFSALFLNLPDPTRGALWYHADYVSPPWASTMAKVTRIGRHLFYRGPLRTVEDERGATG